MSNKNTEFLRAITGPKIEYNGNPVTRYSTWSIGGGLKVDENPFFNKLNLSVDDQHIIDLINQHGGGGGGDASLWAEYPATQDVDMDGHKLTGLVDPTNPQDAATKAYVDTAVSGATGGPWSSIAATSNINANSFRMTNLGSPIAAADAATKAYVDGIAGLAASIAEGELPLTIDSTNSTNITSSAAGPLRYTRIGRTVTLSGLIQLTADSAGAATAAFTGIDGAAAPATNNTWRGIITDQANGTPKNLNIMVYGANNGFRYTVVGAEAGASYRISFVMAYRSAS